MAVPEKEMRPERGSLWYVFNDFVVQNIPEEEALSFPGNWKVNSVIIGALCWALY